MLDVIDGRSVSQFSWSSLVETERPYENTLPVTSPHDQRIIAEVDVCSSSHIDDALQTAHRLFRDRQSWLALQERIGILDRVVRMMIKEISTLATLATLEGGKPLQDSEVEATRAIETVRLAVNEMRQHAGEVIPMGLTESSSDRIAFTQHEPIGVVVAISAFNHPLNLIVHQVTAAVAAGCPVIIKPSEQTPLSCLLFVQMLRRAGLPGAWAQVCVIEEIEVSEGLATDSRAGFLSFIGSARTGWYLRSRIAPGTRCALEHGGAAPVIIAPDIDPALAIPAVLKGGFYHAGQVCVSVQRIFVPADRADVFAEQLSSKARDLRLGDPLERSTEVGPLIRPAEVTRIQEWVNEAIEGGATCLCGGEPAGETFFSPTVLLNPSPDARVSRTEVFGPVVCVYGYENVGQAISQANELPWAFQAAVFTGDLSSAFDISAELDASAVMVNDHTAFRTDDMPFAGLRESGLGIGGIGYSIREMQVSKMTVINNVRRPLVRATIQEE